MHNEFDYSAAKGHFPPDVAVVPHLTQGLIRKSASVVFTLRFHGCSEWPESANLVDA